MKIAIYNVTTASRIGGIETYCIEMAKALNTLGHEAVLVSGRGDSSSVGAIDRIKLFDFTPRERFPDFGNRFRKLMERLSFARNTFSHLRTNGYDAIVITKPYDFPLAWALKKRGYHGQIILHTGGTDFFTADRFFASAVDHFVACSRYTADQNANHYGHRCQVIPNGVDTNHFNPGKKDPVWRSKLNIPPEASIVMTVGRLVGWKGLSTIVRAIVELPELHYVYVGSGPYESSLRALADSLSVTNRVHSVGALPHEKIAAVMQQADIFAQPSVGEEAFGVTVIEAMSCGLPVLASAQGGMLEIITHGLDGFLLPPKDVDAWRSTLQQLIDHPEQRSALGQAARKSILERYTWSSAAAQLVDLVNTDFNQLPTATP